MSPWIKVEIATLDKPEVIAIGAALALDPDAVVGKLLRVWVWADQQTVDGNARGVTFEFLDRLTCCAGFAAAMLAVGWLEEIDGGVRIPRFERHNGKSAKKRAQTARRVTQHRSKCNGASVTNVTQRVTERALTPLTLSLFSQSLPEGGAGGAGAEVSPTGSARWDAAARVVMGLCPGWAEPRVWDPEENRRLMEGGAALEGLTEETLDSVRAWIRHVHRKDGVRAWPRTRSQFLGAIGDVVQKADQWARASGRLRKKRPAAPAAVPAAELASPEEVRAAFKAARKECR